MRYNTVDHVTDVFKTPVYKISALATNPFNDR